MNKGGDSEMVVQVEKSFSQGLSPFHPSYVSSDLSVFSHGSVPNNRQNPINTGASPQKMCWLGFLVVMFAVQIFLGVFLVTTTSVRSVSSSFRAKNFGVDLVFIGEEKDSERTHYFYGVDKQKVSREFCGEGISACWGKPSWYPNREAKVKAWRRSYITGNGKNTRTGQHVKNDTSKVIVNRNHCIPLLEVITGDKVIQFNKKAFEKINSRGIYESNEWFQEYHFMVAMRALERDPELNQICFELNEKEFEFRNRWVEAKNETDLKALVSRTDNGELLHAFFNMKTLFTYVPLFANVYFSAKMKASFDALRGFYNVTKESVDGMMLDFANTEMCKKNDDDASFSSLCKKEMMYRRVLMMTSSNFYQSLRWQVNDKFNDVADRDAQKKAEEAQHVHIEATTVVFEISREKETNRWDRYKDISFPYEPTHDLLWRPKEEVLDPNIERPLDVLFKGNFERAGPPVRKHISEYMEKVKAKVKSMGHGKELNVFIENTFKHMSKKDFSYKRDKVGEYSSLVKSSEVCLAPRGDTPTCRHLFNYIQGGCIPVIMSDTVVLPFEKHIDWGAFSLTIGEMPSDKGVEKLAALLTDKKRLQKMREELMSVRDKLWVAKGLQKNWQPPITNRYAFIGTLLGKWDTLHMPHPLKGNGIPDGLQVSLAFLRTFKKELEDHAKPILSLFLKREIRELAPGGK
eukprot:Nk52_evm15s212 gene=Nk52_evmTU15s212